MVGGRGEGSDALSTVDRYDPAEERWEELTPLPIPTGGLQAFTFEGAILAVGGGSDDAGTVSAAVQRLDPDQGEWEQLPKMRLARHGFGGAVVDGRLFVFGGSPCAGFSASETADSLDLTVSPAS